MRKIASLFIAFLMILSCCIAFSACRDETKKNPLLDIELANSMRKSYIRQFKIKDVAADDVLIEYYAGTYNGYSIVMLDASCHDFDEWQETVEDISIFYRDTNRLLAYKNGRFITLTQAYKRLALLKEDIELIANKFNSEITVFYQICDMFDFEEMPISYDVPLEADFTPDMVLVNMNDKFSELGLVPPPEYFGGDIIKEVKSYAYRPGKYLSLALFLSDPSKENVLYAMSRLKSIPGIESMSANIIMTPDDTVPNDIEYNDQYPWGIDYIELPKVWDFNVGSDSIKVGVIDSGIKDHPDLIANVDSLLSIDIADSTDTFHDDISSHGTHIAGIIGAVGNNAIGITGVNWNVGLVALQAMGDSGAITTFYSADAIEIATDSYQGSSPIRIINYSQGSSYLDYLDDEISDYEGLFICSSGNNGYNIDEEENYRYPSHYASSLYDNPLDNMIVVGALEKHIYDESIFRPSYSNYGVQTVDIYAPGSNIVSTRNDDSYAMASGTSYAAPYVAGVAALLLSCDTDLTTPELKQCILEGADTIIISTPDGSQNVKKLNAWGAFKYMIKNYSTNTYSLANCSVSITDALNGSSTIFTERESMIKLHVPESFEFDFSITATGSGIDVILYDSELNEITTTQTKTNENMTVRFSETLSVGTYYLRTKYSSASISGSINISITHDHIYDQYKRYSSTHHIEACECGATGTVTSLHTVRFTDEAINGKRPCIVCGAMVGGNGDISQIFSNAQMITVNGSFVGTDGIIYLVDEDIDAYFNGTLVFYDKDDLPVTE